MGRYFQGDIEGKFWFGVQDSDDANFFGVEGQFHNLSYYFDTDNLYDIKEGIKTCKTTLGDWKEKLDDFFEKNDSYNEDMLEKQINLTDQSMLEWYARLELGEKILKCVEENDECNFEAEC